MDKVIFNPNNINTDTDNEILLQSQKTSIDFSVILQSNIRVVGFGETHTSKKTKEELIAHMSELHSSGITHLALEFIPADQQELIDDYQRSGNDREKVVKFFKDYESESYMSLIDSATNVGVRVVGIDLPHAEQERRKSELFSSENFTDIKDKNPLEFFLKFIDLHSQLQTGLRDEQFANIINDILDIQPKSKVVFLVGERHLSSQIDSMVGILNKFGRKLTTISLQASDQTSMQGDFLSIIKTSGLIKERFMIHRLFANMVTQEKKRFFSVTGFFIYLNDIDWIKMLKLSEIVFMGS